MKQRRRLGAVSLLMILMVLVVACQPAPAMPPASSIQAPAATAPSTQVAASSSYPREITTADAAAKRDNGAFILDVREPDEWAAFHVPGSTLIPLGQLPSRIDEVPKGKEVVVVCRSGNRSQSGRDVLLNAGYTAVSSMQGGLNKWKAEGLPTVSGK